MKRDELKSQIDDLMNQYANEEIDGATYSQKMMDGILTIRLGKFLHTL